MAWVRQQMTWLKRSNMPDNTNEIEFVRIVKTGDLPEGERLILEINNLPIVIFNVGGELLATGDLCSHDEGPIGDGDIDGDQIVCPRHGARFDIHTGKALTLPAVEGIPVYPIQVVDDFIEIGIPK